LDTSFKALQRLFHPDKFANASAEEKAISAENSSVVNQGYQTLKCRVDRINYVLTTFYNIKVLDEGGSFNDATLMTEVFELRERVEDASIDSYEARLILEEVDSSLEVLTAQIEVLLQKNSAEDLALLKAVAVRFKYYTKIREEVREKLEVN
jgi:molecular chaperone HscB